MSWYFKTLLEASAQLDKLQNHFLGYKPLLIITIVALQDAPFTKVLGCSGWLGAVLGVVEAIN